MKKLLLLLLFPFSVFSQYTSIPDANFELALLNMGYDFVIDGFVETSAIDTVSELYINNKDISDLTGIQEFIALKSLFCYDNNLTTLNLSNNIQLFEITCSENLLTYIDLRNGNNTGLWYFMSMNNPSLSCIDVDDVAWADYNWAKDTWTTFSTNCGSVAVTERIYEKRLLNVVDIYGNKIIPKPNIPLLYIFDDGTVEKRFFVD